jgi:hypothetical protein
MGGVALPLSAPTPLASLVCSLGTLAVVALQRLRATEEAKGDTWFDRLIAGLRALDRTIVHGGSWITGAARGALEVRRDPGTTATR